MWLTLRREDKKEEMSFTLPWDQKEKEQWFITGTASTISLKEDDQDELKIDNQIESDMHFEPSKLWR